MRRPRKIFFRFADATQGSMLPAGEAANTIYMGLGWVSTLSQICAHGLWAPRVEQITDQAR